MGGRDLRDQGLASLSSEEDTIGAVSDRNSLRKKTGTGAHSFHQSGQGRRGGVMGTYQNLPTSQRSKEQIAEAGIRVGSNSQMSKSQ